VFNQDNISYERLEKLDQHFNVDRVGLESHGTSPEDRIAVTTEIPSEQVEQK